MHRIALALAAVLSGLPGGGASAQEGPAFMDPREVDPAMFKDFLGPWRVESADGAKSCRVVFGSEMTIGGMEITVDPGCAKVFPVMDDIAAWGLLEGWGIAFIDPLRRTRIRFTTPDDTYLAEPETDGIFTIQPVEAE